MHWNFDYCLFCAAEAIAESSHLPEEQENKIHTQVVPPVFDESSSSMAKTHLHWAAIRALGGRTTLSLIGNETI